MAETPNLRWVRLVFVDVFGGAHAVVLPAGRFQHAVENGAPFDGSALEGRARHFEADMLLKPDADTLVHLGDGQGRATCTVIGPDGSSWPGDPRTALVAALAERGDLAQSYRAAAELEFYILGPDGLAVDRGGYFSELEGKGISVTRSAAERLAEYGIDVISAHLEAGPGQYELDLASMAPLALADALVLTKQVLREETAKTGLGVTFMARPFGHQPGSGLHLHQFLAEDGPRPADGPSKSGPAKAAQPAAGRPVDGRRALFDGRGGLAADGRSFMAGQLLHAAGLAALAAPNVNSYKRLHSGPEAPSDVVWGHLNRAALVRVGSSGEQRPAIEFRLADPAANPYLLLAALLAAADHGLDTEADPGSPFEEDFGGFDPTSSSSIQARPLPRDLDGALDALLLDDVLVDTFDSRLLSRLVDGRRAEAEAYRAQITPWEVERYLDEA